MNRVERILKALEGKPDILWGVYKGLHDPKRLSPWEWTGKTAMRKGIEGTEWGAAWKSGESRWTFQAAERGKEAIQGSGGSLAEVLVLADLAAGWLLTGDLPKIAAPWVAVHRAEWRRWVDGEEKRVAEVVLTLDNKASPKFTAYAHGEPLPTTYSGLQEAQEAGDAFLAKEGWWLL